MNAEASAPATRSSKSAFGILNAAQNASSCGVAPNVAHRLPIYDQAVGALIQDLHDRGMGDDVLVAAFGEFGRSPVIDKQAGRGHWWPVARSTSGQEWRGRRLGALSRLQHRRDGYGAP